MQNLNITAISKWIANEILENNLSPRNYAVSGLAMLITNNVEDAHIVEHMVHMILNNKQ